MKKSFLLFIGIVILLTSCSSKSEQVEKKTSDEVENNGIFEKKGDLNIANGREILIGEEGYCNIIYFDSEQIIFVKDGDINKELDSANALFYHYDFNSGKTSFFSELENVSFSTQDIALLNNRVYYPLSIKQKKESREYIFEISLDDLSNRLVKSSETDSIVTRLEVAKNEIYQYYQRNLSSDATDFFIDNIGALGSKKNIINMKYQNNSGKIMVSSCIYEDKIYTYSIICGEKEQSVIEEFSLEGNLLKQYKIDLEDFLKLKEVDDTDAIYRIFREGDYIILNSLNNRIKIFKISAKKLLDVETPPEFEKLLGARVIENYGDESGYTYFEDANGDNALYVFDTEDGDISKIDLISEGIQSCNLIRDESGNIIVIGRLADNNYRYFLIDSSDVIKHVKR